MGSCGLGLVDAARGSAGGLGPGSRPLPVGAGHRVQSRFPRHRLQWADLFPRARPLCATPIIVVVASSGFLPDTEGEDRHQTTLRMSRAPRDGRTTM